jgi:hypothetical protein
MKMNLIYTGEKLPGYAYGFNPSIFLAGPTPRDAETKSWRPEAIRLLETARFSGSVMVPEWRDMNKQVQFDSQVEWENDGLEQATVIAFWIPRNLENMPAFTTNVEFGRYVGRKTVVYGRPPDAPKNAYLDWYYTKKTSLKPLDTLLETMNATIVEIVCPKIRRLQ